MSTTESINPTSTSLPYRKRLYSGRMNRVNYLMANIIVSLLFVVFIALFSFVIVHVPFVLKSTYIVIFAIFSVSCIVAVYMSSFQVRRGHELGYSGRVATIIFVPVIGILGVIWFFIAQGQQNNNKYGNPPTNKINIREIFGLKTAAEGNTINISDNSPLSPR